MELFPLPSAPPSAPASTPVQRPAPAVWPPLPEQLHPTLWRAHQLGRERVATCGSGFVELDAELPGGGWPSRALSELLLAHPGIGEIRLLAPALAAVQRSERCVMFFDPPAALCGWTLSALGIDLCQLTLVRARPLQPVTDVLWALEHALKSGHVGAVLAWLPKRLRGDALRRLQLAAQAHDGPAFVLRELSERDKPSAAPLRLALAPAGPDELAVHLLKRRGPPRLQPLLLPLMPVLSEPARARAAAGPAAGEGVDIRVPQTSRATAY